MSMLENKLEWPLMKDCITAEDKSAMIDFIINAGRFTNGPMVKKFEQEWSKWLGCKHSLFVSSGSTANTLLVAAIKEKYNLKEGDRVMWSENSEYDMDIDGRKLLRMRNFDVLAVYEE